MNPPTERQAALDAIKIFLTLLVIVHHTGQVYGPTGGFWPVRDATAQPLDWLGQWFFPVNAGFFMGLFFFLSGLVVPSSLSKGGRQFVLKRLIRLGIPLVFGVLVLIPFEMWIHFSFFSPNAPLDFGRYFTSVYLGINPPADLHKSIVFPEINFGHLWYVENLLVFSLLALPFFVRTPTVVAPPARPGSILFGGLVVVGFAIGLLYAVVRSSFPIDRWIALGGVFQTEPAHLPQYLLFFVAGILCGRYQLSPSALPGGPLLWSLVAMALVAPFPWARQSLGVVWPWYDAFLGLVLSVAVWKLAHRIPWSPTPRFQSLARGSYLTYILHVPIVMGCQVAFSFLTLPTGMKFLGAAIASVGLSFTLPAAMLRVRPIRQVVG